MKRVEEMKKTASILFLTSNPHKIAEAKTILKPFGVNIIASSGKGGEIQSDSVEFVARRSAESAYRKIRKPLFVEDSGLYVDALGGFPGAFSAFALKTISNEGILRLLTRVRVRSRPEERKAPGGLRARALDQQRQRSAKFVCAVAYVDSRGTKVFRGVVKGRISTRIARGEGFGFDPIFIPAGHSKPFSLMPDVKMQLSHRAIALSKLGAYLSR